MACAASGKKTVPVCRKSGMQVFWRAIKQTKYLHLMILPGILYYIIFCYGPMYGIQIAFKNFKFGLGIVGSQWVGLKHFIRFFNHPYCFRLIRNTFLISLYSLIFGFPAPILFALILNEVRAAKFKKFVQTVSYLPNFISTVAIVGMITMILSPSTGFVNNILKTVFGMEPIYFMMEPRWFRTIYIASGIWQSCGWNAIIYLAALSGINPELYEAATIDGAGRFRQILAITLPGIRDTIVVLFILNLGSLLSVGSEKIILMYNSMTRDVADVISSFVYRVGLIDSDYSYSTAVGLLNSVVNMIFLLGGNALTRKLADFSLW